MPPETDLGSVPDYPALLRQDGRNAVVIGAGDGMGRQAAHALASVGARLFCVDINAERATAVAAEVGGTPFVANAAVRDEVGRAFAAAVAEMGSVHTVVDVVGHSGEPSSLRDQSDEQWDATFGTNFGQCRYVLQAGGRAVAEAGGGSMTFVTSVMAFTAAPRFAAYGAAKAALVSLVRSAAVELGPAVRVNCIAPAHTLTPRLASWMDDDERNFITARLPVGRLGLPQDQAGAMLFLASDLAGYITGQCLNVDGGLLPNLLHAVNRDGLWPGESARS
jgi:NAD(P)-dependent dehydrogenase (short-subunit alcohol dehydrogenase family)